MNSNLGQLKATRKTGDEPFHYGMKNLQFDVLSFWRWSVSDLLSNATRGILAEYIVARALGIGEDDLRDEWAAYDLKTQDGTKVEVKASAYLQSWFQKKLSTITFLTKKTRAYDPETGAYSDVLVRQADVYVFALLAHKDKSTVDPLDIAQWQFYVLPTCVLNERIRSQHSIALTTLKGLAGESVLFSGLKDAVGKAAEKNNSTSKPPL